MTTPVDIVAQTIRIVDGDHSMGAAELAEVVIDALRRGAASRLCDARQALDRRPDGWAQHLTEQDVIDAILGPEAS